MITEVRNFLPVNYLRDIQNYVTNDLTWAYSSDTTYVNKLDIGMGDKHMSALIIPNLFANPEQNKYSFLYPILYIMEEKFGVVMKRINRFKVNMTFCYSQSYTSPAWHIDDVEPNSRSMILYVNDSDGDTIIVNSKETKENFHIITDDERAALSSMEKTVSKFEQNKAIIFDSNLYHYGELPKFHKNRVVMNIIFGV